MSLQFFTPHRSRCTRLRSEMHLRRYPRELFGRLLAFGANGTAIGAVQTMLLPRHVHRRCRLAAAIARGDHPGCHNAWRHDSHHTGSAGGLFPARPPLPCPPLLGALKHLVLLFMPSFLSNSHPASSTPPGLFLHSPQSDSRMPPSTNTSARAACFPGSRKSPPCCIARPPDWDSIPAPFPSR